MEGDAPARQSIKRPTDGTASTPKRPIDFVGAPLNAATSHETREHLKAQAWREFPGGAQTPLRRERISGKGAGPDFLRCPAAPRGRDPPRGSREVRSLKRIRERPAKRPHHATKADKSAHQARPRSTSDPRHHLHAGASPSATTGVDPGTSMGGRGPSGKSEQGGLTFRRSSATTASFRRPNPIRRKNQPRAKGKDMHDSRRYWHRPADRTPAMQRCASRSSASRAHYPTGRFLPVGRGSRLSFSIPRGGGS